MFNLLILDVILIIGTSDRTPLTAAPFGDIAAKNVSCGDAPHSLITVVLGSRQQFVCVNRAFLHAGEQHIP